jgi:PST family polysaccharide transporter
MDAAATATMSLGKAVGRGFSWLTLSLLAGRMFAAISQLALGRWISAEEFRDFAIVASIAALVKIFQDGGVPQVLIQRGSAEFDRLVGPAFWLSAAFGVSGGLMLAIAAPLFAWLYDAPGLIVWLLVIAATLPLGAASTIMRAKLRVDLRFKALAVIAVLWFFLRHGGTIALAAIGLGVISMVLPLLLVSMTEWVAGCYATGMKPWRKSADVREWPKLLGSSIWVAAAATFRGLGRNGDYLVLGLLASKGVVGKYFFGYQLTAQIVDLLAINLQQVLFPALSRLAGEPARQSRAVIRTVRMLMLVAAPASLALTVISRPGIAILDAVIWNNKWSAVIPLMQIFAVTAPIRMFSDVMTAALSSRGEFRGSALLLLAEGIWVMLAAALAVAIYGPSDLTGIALVVAICQAIFSIGSTSIVLRRFGISPQSFFGAFLPAWLTAVAAAALAAGAQHLFTSEAHQLTRLTVGAVAFAAAFVTMTRIFLRSDLDELSRVMPGRAAKIMQRALLLPRPLPT